jgi:hypothetical protein
VAAALAQDALDLMDRLAIQRFSVIGTSGGLLSLNADLLGGEFGRISRIGCDRQELLFSIRVLVGSSLLQGNL